MKKNKKEQNPGNKIAAKIIVATPAKRPFINSPSIWAWLLSSLLFFVFSSTIAPLFWFPAANETSGNADTLHTILGIVGILTYFIEPIILTIYKAQEEANELSYQKDSTEGEGLLHSAINTIFLLLIGLPVMVITFFRPVFRAMLLFISFSYLNLPGGESRLFFLIVITDIFLYYSSMWFPKWKFNPAKLVIKYFKIRENVTLLKTGAVFFIFYTALIYFVLGNLGYYSDPGHKAVKGEREILLLFSWFTATIYTRLPFIPDDPDIVGIIRKTPRRSLLFQIIILAISLVGYLWPYFSGRG